MDDKLAPVQPPSVQLDDFWLDGDEFPPEDVAQVLSLENEDSTSTPLKSLQSDKALAAMEDTDNAKELSRNEPPPEDVTQDITFENDGSTPSLKSPPSDKTLDSIAIEDNNAIEERGDSFEGAHETGFLPDLGVLSTIEVFSNGTDEEVDDMSDVHFYFRLKEQDSGHRMLSNRGADIKRGVTAVGDAATAAYVILYSDDSILAGKWKETAISVTLGAAVSAGCIAAATAADTAALPP